MAGFEQALKIKRDAESMQSELTSLMEWSQKQKQRDEVLKSSPQKAANGRGDAADASVKRSIDAFATSAPIPAADSTRAKPTATKQSRSTFSLLPKSANSKGKNIKSVADGKVTVKDGNAAPLASVPSQPATPEIKREARSPPKPRATEHPAAAAASPAATAATSPNSGNISEADQLRDCGNMNFRKGNYEEARAAYSASIAASPSALALANRAMVGLKQQQWVLAEADATAALAFDANYGKAWQRRAAARLKIGNLEKVLGAVEDLERAIRLQPDSAALAAERAAAVKIYHGLPGAISRPSSKVPIRIVDSSSAAALPAGAPSDPPATATQPGGTTASTSQSIPPAGSSAEASPSVPDSLLKKSGDSSLPQHTQQRTQQQQQQQQQAEAEKQQSRSVPSNAEPQSAASPQASMSAPPQPSKPEQTRRAVKSQQSPQQLLRGCQIEEIEDDPVDHGARVTVNKGSTPDSRGSSLDNRGSTLDSSHTHASGSMPCAPADSRPLTPVATEKATSAALPSVSTPASTPSSNTGKHLTPEDASMSRAQPSKEQANTAAQHLQDVQPIPASTTGPAAAVTKRHSPATQPAVDTNALSTAAVSDTMLSSKSTQPSAAAATPDGTGGASTLRSMGNSHSVSGSTSAAAAAAAGDASGSEAGARPGSGNVASAATLAALAESLTKLTPPRTGADFERSWRMLVTQPERQAGYLAMIAPAALPALLRTQLTAPLLESLLPPLLDTATTAAATPSAAAHAMKMLATLPDVQRFVLAAMSVPPSHRRILAAKWDAAVAAVSEPEVAGTNAADAKQLLCLLKPTFLL